MKIVTVIGARPQFIKAVSLSKVLIGNIEEVIIHTGQHYDSNMSDIFFDELKIPKPKYQFDLGGGSHAKQTGQMLVNIEDVLIKENPNLVVVYGDTNSTLAGGLAASKLNIPVAHIEAGLRSFNRKMPEETNRILTDHLSKYLFVPSQESKDQLIKEGITENVFIVGDIMYDSILNFKELASNNSKILDRLHLKKNEYSVATIHRAENTDNPQNLSDIFDTLNEIGKIIILPIHPRTKLKLKEYDIRINEELIFLIDPIGYLDMINLTMNSYCIFTDSGGLQKEAYYLKVPCITLREETEWKETVRIGWNVVTGTNKNKILSAFHNLNHFTNPYQTNLYGNGSTSLEILNILKNINI